MVHSNHNEHTPGISMRRLAFACALCAGAVVQPAMAGPYADDLARCMVSGTSDSDKSSLVRWIFANASVHPDVSSIAAVGDAQRAEINQAMGKLITRLFAENCRQEAKEALQYEGQPALQTSFGVLGQVAMMNLMSNPAVAASFNGLSEHIDVARLGELAPALAK
jgi:hypothetical protein